MFWRKVIAYFLVPFPSRQGFSAYRMPGPAVHLAILMWMLFVGSALCLGHPSAAPLIAVWGIVGLYLGRDLTIGAHYAPILALLGLGLLLVLLAGATILPRDLSSLWSALAAYASRRPATAWIATAAVAAVQAFQFARMTKEP